MGIAIEPAPQADALVIHTVRTPASLRRSVIGMYRWAPRALFVMAIAVVAVIACSVGTPSHRPLDWLPPVVGIVSGLGFMVWMTTTTVRRLADKAQREGSPVFTITRDTVKYTTTVMSAEVAWRAVHSVCVSPHTLYIFTTRSCALFIDRGAHDARFLELARAAGVRVRGA